MTKSDTSSTSAERQAATVALLDAAERLLITEGAGRITTRRVATEAGVNHGLVHYYFGSMEELLMQVLERFTNGIVVRQREMYAGDGPILDKRRAAWRFHEDDLASGYPKVWFELQAMAWNQPRMRERLFAINEEWRSVLADAFDRARSGLDLDLPPTEALVALVMMFAQGAQLERLLGIDRGHADLLAWIDAWLERASR
jgi:AcrR family transcriptional regulator